MKTSVENENSIFLSTILGALLFVAAIGVMISYVANITTQQASYPIAGALSIPSLILLYRAIKSDKRRAR
jgi:hypothetical protein